MENEFTQEDKKVYLQCPYQNCKYKWYYGGRFLFYATCPSCHRNIKIDSNKIFLQPAKIGRSNQTNAVENHS